MAGSEHDADKELCDLHGRESALNALRDAESKGRDGVVRVLEQR